MSNVYEDYEPPVSKGLYHTFEDNKTYTMRIVSEPVGYLSTFERGDKVTERMMYAWLVWNFETESVQVMKLPKTAYKEIAKFGKDPEYGDPQEYNLRITRTGKNFDTKYDIVASPKKQKLVEIISQEDFEKILDVDVIEAVSKGKGVSNVNWLKDFAKGEGTTEQEENKNTAPATPNKPGEEEDW